MQLGLSLPIETVCTVLYSLVQCRTYIWCLIKYLLGYFVFIFKNKNLLECISNLLVKNIYPFQPLREYTYACLTAMLLPTANAATSGSPVGRSGFGPLHFVQNGIVGGRTEHTRCVMKYHTDSLFEFAKGHS